MTETTMHSAGSPAALRGGMPTDGRWGWYRDHEGYEWKRVSTLVKKVETDTYSLEKWKLRQVLIGAARRDDLITGIKAMGKPDPLTGWTDDQKKTQNELAEKAMEAAKDSDGAITGTAVHTLTERLDRGESVEDVVRGLPAPLATTLRAYAFLRRENGWETVEVERTVVCQQLEVAGTFDRVERITGLTALLGPWVCQHGHRHEEESQVVADVKTENAPWLNGLHIGPQLGIYSRSLLMWVPTGGRVPLYWQDSGKPRMGRDGTQLTAAAGEYVPAPCVRQDVGVVVHLRDGHAEPIFINLIEGWEAAEAAYSQSLREARAGRKLGTAGAWFVPMPNVKRPAVAQFVTEQAVVADHANPNRPPDRAPQLGERVTVGAKVFAGVDDGNGSALWREVEPPVGTQVAARGVLDEVDRQAIEAVWAAVTVDDLSKTWDIYVNTIGRKWGGRVAEAAESRRRQIECPQRQLHSDGKCACGWATGVPA